MSESRKAELHLAYQWDCDECGVENFCRSVRVELSEEDEKQVRDEWGVQPWELGDYRTRPTKVVCRACETVFDCYDTGNPMSEAKHTPGPWKKSNDLILADEDQMMVCDIRGWGYLETRFGSVEAVKIQDANAQLIAASPDLLAACKAARQYLNLLFVREQLWTEKIVISETIYKLGAAIEKAEGTDDV